jgi:RNA polymerase sigma factor (sigma-70 family)
MPILAQDTTVADATLFTRTHWSLVLLAGEAASPRAQAALEQLCRSYWFPLYAFVRRQGHTPTDAQDLTQEFFARLLARNDLAGVHPQKGKFRSFLLASLKHFLANEWDRVKAEKRGGSCEILSLERDMAETRLLGEPTAEASPECEFERRWALTLMEQALARLKHESAANGKAAQFGLLLTFLSREAGPGAYAGIGERLGMKAGAVAVAVHRLRQRYGELLRAEIAQTVTSPKEVEEEMHHLFEIVNR